MEMQFSQHPFKISVVHIDFLKFQTVSLLMDIVNLVLFFKILENMIYILKGNYRLQENCNF